MRFRQMWNADVAACGSSRRRARVANAVNEGGKQDRAPAHPSVPAMGYTASASSKLRNRKRLGRICCR